MKNKKALAAARPKNSAKRPRSYYAAELEIFGDGSGYSVEIGEEDGWGRRLGFIIPRNGSTRAIRRLRDWLSSAIEYVESRRA